MPYSPKRTVNAFPAAVVGQRSPYLAVAQTQGVDEKCCHAQAAAATRLPSLSPHGSECHNRKIEGVDRRPRLAVD